MSDSIYSFVMLISLELAEVFPTLFFGGEKPPSKQIFERLLDGFPVLKRTQKKPCLCMFSGADGRFPMLKGSQLRGFLEGLT